MKDNDDFFGEENPVNDIDIITKLNDNLRNNLLTNNINKDIINLRESNTLDIENYNKGFIEGKEIGIIRGKLEALYE